MDAPHPGGLGGTYGGNPLACAAALAAIETYETEGLIERAQQLGALMHDRLLAIQRTDPRVGDVRGRGAMVAVEFVDSGGRPDGALAASVARSCIEHGVIVLTCGSAGNVIRLLPPLAIGDDLLHDGLDVLQEALAAA